VQKFNERLIKSSKDIWRDILNHNFLASTAQGTIGTDTFKSWIKQDYLFVREAIPFVAILLAKAPENLHSNFIQILAGLDKELVLFRRNAEAHAVKLEGTTPYPICHAYIQFLMTVAYRNTFEEGFTVLYAAEKAYLDSWLEVKTNLRKDSPWQEFIDNWTSSEFIQYVAWLSDTLNELVGNKPESVLLKMEELFLVTARYEYLFWDMAAGKKDWPV
jgi:thiaminase